MSPAGLLLLALALPAAARNVDDNDASAFAGAGSLLRVDYANDTFTGTDRYYTEGFGAELFRPALERSPVMRALIGLPESRSYGLLLRQSLFTPSRIGEPAPIPGDRPWAATLFLGHVLVSRDPERGLVLTAELDAGVIGPAAGGEVQSWVHKRLALNDLARGWSTQIRNSPVLDYYARLEKTLQSAGWEDLGVYGDATAGTLYDNAAAGGALRAGRLDGKTRVYGYARAEEKLVGYDATLEGGPFGSGGAYALRAGQVERFVPRWDFGAVLDAGGWALEIERTTIGREFTGGLRQQWVQLSAMKRF